MPENHLVCFDTDRIKEYVFETDKLREVRGASALLSELNERQAMKELVSTLCSECQVIYSAGGSAAVVAPSAEKAAAVIAGVEAKYRESTITASISGISVPLSPATRESGLGKRMELASLRLREKKDLKARRNNATIEPYIQPCAACERYPASEEMDGQAICLSCRIKRERFDDERERDSQSPRDLGEIGERSRPPGYIGFIYADGNNMGERLRQLQSAQDCDNFASGLDRLVKGAVDESLAAYGVRRGKWPYERLLIGGDDLMLVTAGDIALPMALRLSHLFEGGSLDVVKQSHLSDSQPLTLGVGVVISHAGFPVTAFHRLARDLCKRAKQRSADANHTSSAIDFMVVTAAGSSDVSTVREEALSEQAFVFPHGNLHARLTRRPYTLEEAELLLKHTQNFKRAGFPSSQLQFLYEGLFHSLVEGTFRWRKAAGRVKAEHRKLMDEFHAAFGNDVLPPWRGEYQGGERTYVTALGDLVEIYPFIHAEKQEGSYASVNN